MPDNDISRNPQNLQMTRRAYLATCIGLGIIAVGAGVFTAIGDADSWRAHAKAVVRIAERIAEQQRQGSQQTADVADGVDPHADDDLYTETREHVKEDMQKVADIQNDPDHFDQQKLDDLFDGASGIVGAWWLETDLSGLSWKPCDVMDYLGGGTVDVMWVLTSEDAGDTVVWAWASAIYHIKSRHFQALRLHVSSAYTRHSKVTPAETQSDGSEQERTAEQIRESIKDLPEGGVPTPEAVAARERYREQMEAGQNGGGQ